MATLKRRLYRKNSSGTYDTVYLETDASIIIGTLPISHGGTGNTTGLAASATKLATARTIRTNLGSTSAASFNGTANITPGISGVLPVENGGTGVTNLNALKNALGISSISTIISGTYTGDDTNGRFINIGITPKAILISAYGWAYNSGVNHLWFATNTSPVKNNTKNGVNVCSISTNGFIVASSDYPTSHPINYFSYIYHYIAFT